jgi:gliding motility-associated-like protein
MKRVALLALLLLLPWLVRATHIVGGELNLQYTGRSYQFTLSLNLYFDEVNGERDVEDAEIFVAAFSKQTDKRIATFTLPRLTTAMVEYTSAACKNGRLQTRQIRYSEEITLDPATYNEAGGYYFSFERCCRNRTIVNITEPGDNGMVFYLEFPAVYQNNARYTNSSPAFSVPKGDYACVNERFFFDFGATDADGDELKYSLISPKRGNSDGTGSPFSAGPHPGALNIFYPAPYATVTWAPGFSLANLMAGPEPLRVNAGTGQVSFVASRIGLYVFSVLCEEYRHGQKIGAVQRDFQLLVIDCPKNNPPAVQAKKVNSSIVYAENETVQLSYGGQACLEVLAIDPDRNSTLTLQVNPLNFSAGDISFPATPGQTNGAGDTLRSQLCFTACIPHTSGTPLLLQVIASDNGCPVPKRDTMLLSVFIAPVPTSSPQVTTTLEKNETAVQTGQPLSFEVTATDPDNDQLRLYAVGEGFSLAEAGMQFANSSGTGNITQLFSWTPGCQAIEASATYIIHFITEDNSCSPNRSDTVTVQLNAETFELVLSRFSPPNVFTPNNDGANDSFQIPNLPPDNCEHIFQRIDVYNRWGQPVFTAYEREFQWSGHGFPAGTYYYLINYGTRVFKGTVSLLR